MNRLLDDFVMPALPGLTASKLVIAADVLNKHSEFTCPSKLDPSIESLELVSIYPLEFVALSIFSRRKRTTLKARLVDGRAKYYELGGMERRSVYRALWMEHVRRLNAKKQDGSSLSETTAASSSSASTLYLLSSGIETKEGGSKYRVWAHYGGAGGDGHRPNVARRSSWRRKDIYLGPSYEKLSHQGYYTPVPVRFAGASLEQVNRELLEDVGRRTPMRMKSLVSRKTRSSSRVEFTNRAGGAQQLCDVLFTRERNRNLRRSTSSTSSTSSNGKKRRFRAAGCTIPASTKHSTALAPKLSRFGFGIGENCASGLYLEAWQGDKAAYRISKSARIDSAAAAAATAAGLIDSGVRVWECPGDGKFRRKSRSRHPRRYALATAAHFFHALGPWSVQPGERESVQRARACSAVCIRRQPLEPELRLAVSKRQLAASVSMTSLDPAKCGTAMHSSWSTTRGGRRVLLFWTPEYWYRPRAATAAYQELRRHLSLIRDFRASKERAKKPFFSKFGKSSNDNNINCRGDCGESKINLVSAQVRSSCILGRIFSSKEAATAAGVKKKKRGEGEQQAEGVSSRLRRLLKMDLRITAWDLDSWTIARQLTLIDRELFLRIPWAEIEILLNQKSSRNAPNLGAWIAFAHRISCLTASEILATKKLDMRTRLLSRLINAADKCYAFGNFHSCRSILAGLESPAIYRLRATWSRLRTRHSTRYDTMERLCRIYRNTRSRLYGEAWKKCERKAPCLPYVGHLVDKIIYRQDGAQAAAGFVQNDDSCRSIARVCSTTIESACRKIVETEEKTKEEKLVEPRPADRRSLSKRIVSAAMSKIGCSKSTTTPPHQPGRKSNEDIAWTVRQEKLAKKYYARWRLSILTKKILADKEAKLAAMDPKKLAVMRIGSWLYECQKNCQQYNFSRHSFAWEFLLKARYREERDNFFTSLKLEPPLG